MNLPIYSLKNRKVIYFFLSILLVGGIYAFFKLPKKEDAPFIIKQAILTAYYPGANPMEVEKNVVETIERDLQTLSDVYNIKSKCYFGLSETSVELKSHLSPQSITQKWDELRRKVANMQSKLPAGVTTLLVNDDFGDVFGIYYALTADEGFTYNDMRNWAQKIMTELNPLSGVQKVFLFGEQAQVVNVFISVPKLSNLGIDPTAIKQVLQTQNLLVNTGEITTGTYQLRVRAEGTYKSIQDIREQLIVTKSGAEVRLGDIAQIEKGYADPPSTLMRVNGKRAIGIGVSTGAEDDVVDVGNRVTERLKELKQRLPVGMELETIYPEDKIAEEANNGFILNLIESLLIVIVIIFLVMGSRAGMLVGSSLLFSVGGTLLIMWIWGVGLNRTSLAAFIIAMGMLVDNAIVVTDNAQVGIKRGLSRYQALVEGATKPQWALLGATFIAVCSFLPLYLAPASVAEIVKPLFIVLAVSLGLSWLLALTQTTTFGNFILKESKAGEYKDPYDTKLYHTFEKVLGRLIKYRYITLTTVVLTLFLSLFIMSIMPQSFFPIMNKPYFRADLIFPEGYGIEEVQREVEQIEKDLKKNDKLKSYSFTLGASPIRYYLASSSVGQKPNFANVLIETKQAKEAPEEESRFYEYMVANYPNILTRSSLFALSPVPDAAIEIGFIGDNIDTLVALTQQAKKIAYKNNYVMEVRNSWGNKVPVWKPLYSQEKGLRLGITRQQMAYSLRAVTNGVPLGEYREGDLSMPILLKDEGKDSMNLNDIKTLPVHSAKGKSVKVEQVIDNFSLDYEFSVIKRYNRQRYMLMQCEPKRGTNTMAIFKQLWQEIKEGVAVPTGYKLQYFGEQAEQDKGNSAIAANIPLMFGIIYVTLLFLFPTYYRKPVLIMCMLPLIFIGVVLGLLLFGKSLDFFAILGLLGLIGMNIKNAIVLVEEIDLQLSSGLIPVKAVIEATKTRIVPVTMASGTTILGMLPLLGDAMFAGMAATIMGGLFVSTLLTIFILPVTYCIFFHIKSE